MKRLMRSLAAKITAIALLLVLLLLTTASGAGIVYLFMNGGFTDGGEYAIQSMIDSVAWSDMSRLGDVYLSTLQEDTETSMPPVFSYRHTYSSENSNFYFTITDDQGRILLQNYTEPNYRSEYLYDDIVVLAEETRRVTRFCATEELVEEYRVELEAEYEVTSFVSIAVRGGYSVEAQYVVRETQNIHIHGYVRTVLTARDKYFRVAFLLECLLPLRNVLLTICAAGLLLSLALIVFLLCAAGQKAGHAGVYFTWVDRIPLDLYFLFLLLIAGGLAWLLSLLRYEIEIYILLFILFIPLWGLLLLSFGLTFAVRAKAGRWWCNTLIRRLTGRLKRALLWLVHGLRYVCRCLPLYWKVGLCWGILSVAELVFILLSAYHYERVLIFWAAEEVLLTPLVVVATINMRKLQRGGENIAQGNMESEIDLRYMLPVFRQHGAQLNGISQGFQAAIEETTRSERLKAELIANVSHDIKTPLTSIVSYVDLLKKNGLQSKDAPQYLEVLDRQSARLKKLTEDLIEASKASTGNIAVHAEPTDVNVLLTQAGGEYEEKLRNRQLELILDLAPEQPCINADGRLLWRVFDNLLSNICKYAMPKTRVYLSSAVKDGQLTVAFRNISASALNISSEELMERFVRGDASRNTEGSGLGLSIARSLSELQGGSFDILIDGDLFKAVVTFPLLEDKAPG